MPFFLDKLQQKKNKIFFVVISIVLFFLLTNLITYFSSIYCENSFLINIDKSVDFKQFYFYQSNLFELKNHILCLGSVNGPLVIYSASGYIFFSQILLSLFFVILKNMSFLQLFQKITIFLFLVFIFEYLFNYKTNLNLINYVTFFQTTLFLGFFYEDR
jgi:hypothetical protein